MNSQQARFSDQYLEKDLRDRAIELLRPHLNASAKAAAHAPEVIAKLKSLRLPGDDGFRSAADTAVELCAATEALAWGDISVCYSWLVSRQVAWIISQCGTDAQKERWLPRFEENPLLPASLYLYEGSGARIDEMSTRISVRGNDHIVTGYKSPVFHADTAEVSVVVGLDGEGALAAVIGEGQLGNVRFGGVDAPVCALAACAPATEAWIDDLKLPIEARLNVEGLRRAIVVCRLAHAAACVGMAQAATRYAGEWAQRRQAFGKAIIGFQGIAFPLANLLIEADAVKMGILDLAARAESGPNIELSVDAVIARVNRLVEDASRLSVQTMGVHGIISDHPTSAWYQAAPMLASVDFDPACSPFLPA